MRRDSRSEQPENTLDVSPGKFLLSSSFHSIEELISMRTYSGSAHTRLHAAKTLLKLSHDLLRSQKETAPNTPMRGFR